MKRFNALPLPTFFTIAPMLLCLTLLWACGDDPSFVTHTGNNGTTITATSTATTATTTTGAGGDSGGGGGQGGSGTSGEGGAAIEPCPEKNTPGGQGDAGSVTDLFVDPVFGNDACPATKYAPVHSLTQALSLAKSGQTIHLNAGAYTYHATTGEDFSSPVPDGVIITADQNGEAVLVGLGAPSGLAFLGSGAANNLTIQGFAEGITANTGDQSLVGVKLIENACGVRLKGDAHATLTDVSVSQGMIGIELFNGSSLDAHGGVLRDLGKICTVSAKVLGVYNAASITLDGVTLRDSFGPIAAHNAATIAVTNSTIERVGQPGCGSSTAIELGEASSLHLKDTTVSDGHGAAISAFSAGVTVDILGGAIHAKGYSGLSLGVAMASINGTTLIGDSTTYGIHLDFGALKLTNVSIHSFLAGLHQIGGATTMRDAKVTNCTYGVLFLGGGLDLGKSGDPGSNTLTGNTDTALYIGSSASVTIPALGNGWMPLSQGVSALGVLLNHGTILGPFGENAPIPRNFVLTAAGPQVTY